MRYQITILTGDGLLSMVTPFHFTLTKDSLNYFNIGSNK